MKMSKKQLSLKAAKEQGYEFYGLSGQDHLDFLEDLDLKTLQKHYANGGDDLFLSERFAVPAVIMDGSKICEWMAEVATEEIHESGVESITCHIFKYKDDFQKIIDRLIEEMPKNATCTYEQTEIKLVP